MKFDALLDLLSDTLRGLAIGWREGLVVAKSATSETHLSVAIWAGETRIYRHLLHTLTKASAEI
jgi:hypothetical protein